MTQQRAPRSEVAQRILDQATRLFARHGFVGASLRDIAKAVGIRKPSLLYHFPSKDELRRGVLAQMLAHWNEAVPRILGAAHSGPEQFDAIAQEVVGFFQADSDRAPLLVREFLDRPDEAHPLIEQHVQPWSKRVCEYIRKGQQQGRIYPQVDPEAYVAHTIIAVLTSFATLPTVPALIPTPSPGGGNPQHRFLAELLRSAKAALFVPMATDATHDAEACRQSIP